MSPRQRSLDVVDVVVYTDGGFLPHNAASRYGHGGWAWWVNADLHDSGPYLNAESSEHVERLAVERALAALAGDERRLLVVSDNTGVVAMLHRMLAHPFGTPPQWGHGWATLAALVRERGAARLSVLHTLGHGRGARAHRRGNTEADRLATKARKAAAKSIPLRL